jgi:5-hydroxyisourate hydrolase
MSVSTHVLDAVRGVPAAGVAVTLAVGAGSLGESPGPDPAPWLAAESGVTDADGRYRFRVDTPAGTYRLTFATGPYFAAQGAETFYPEVAVTFTAGDGHFHVPLLLSPFAYSTYRGS